MSDASTPSPETRFEGALGLLESGRLIDARRAFEALDDGQDPLPRIELARISVLERREVAEAITAVRAIANDPTHAETIVEARARHVLGHGLAVERRHVEAIDELRSAAAMLARLGCERDSGRAYDTLGMTASAAGQHDSARTFYAISLGLKAAQGDEAGVALTLGNLGRLLLKTDNTRDARTCFEIDLRISEKLGDQRGRGRMLNDLGRVHRLEGDRRQAMKYQIEAVGLARQTGNDFLEMHSQKDLAILNVEDQNFDLARDKINEGRICAARLDGAARLLGETLFDQAEGELALRQNDSRAIDRLRSACRGYRKLQLPDEEIAGMILLARAHCQIEGDIESARQVLGAARKRTYQDDAAHHRRAVREAFASLGTKAPIEEDAQPLDLEQPDGYTCLELIGEGGYGRVYRAFDDRRNREVAIKVLKLDEIRDPAGRNQIVQSILCELEATSEIDHPGVVEVISGGFDTMGRRYVVSAFVDGDPLNRAMPEDGGSIDDCLRLGTGLASALCALHGASQPVIHRDLKPQNVIVPRGRRGHLLDRAILIDFGIALHGAKKAQDDYCVGTLEYLAPEQARFDQPTTASDVYALGVILFQWLTGELPLNVGRRLPMKDALALVADAERARLDEHRRDLPDGLSALLESMLDLDPGRRPSSERVLARLGTLQGTGSRPTS